MEQEKSRILAHGGRIENDGYNFRVYSQEGPGPGLNMTRSFGDLQGRGAGIISIPDVTQVQLSKDDRFLVVCSDGVWEFMSESDVDAIVTKALADLSNPAEELASESLQLWQDYA